MKFSIIIPIYNTKSEYLEYNLNVIKNIKSEEIEILLVDDGSDIYIQKICNQYTDNDSRYKYFKLKNSGVSNARNYGIEQSKGTYIIFLDADDYLNIDTLNKIIENNQYFKDITIFDYSRVYDNKTVLRKLNLEYGIYQKNEISYIYEKLVTSNILNSIHSKIYKSSIIKEKSIIFPSGIKSGEDLIFNLKYFINCNNAEYICNVLTNYRIYEESCVRKFPISRFSDFEKEFESRLETYKKVKYALQKDTEEKIYSYGQTLLFMNILNSRICNNSFEDIFNYLEESKIINKIIYFNTVKFANKIKMFFIKHKLKIILEIICKTKKIKGLI